MVSITNVSAAPQAVETTQVAEAPKVEEQAATRLEKENLVAKADVNPSTEVAERADIADVENKA